MPHVLGLTAEEICDGDAERLGYAHVRTGIGTTHRDRPRQHETAAVSMGITQWFAVSQVAGPALLYLPGSQPFRVPLRIGVFGLSLTGLVWCLRRSRVARTHPSWNLLLGAAIYMAVMLLHPATNTTKAGLAQIGMHLAVTAPLFWCPITSGETTNACSSADNPLGP